MPAPKTILVVEDDQEIRSTIAEILRDEGHTVVCAGHGQEALELLERGPRPDLILLDLMMPVMDGWQFREAQRSNAKWSSIPVVVLTAAGHLGERLDSLQASSFLRKPLGLDQLLEALDRV